MPIVPETIENQEQCRCKQCPSYPVENLHDEILYCGSGQSECEIEPNSCLCPNCPVAKQYNLSEDYYCQQGVVEQ